MGTQLTPSPPKGAQPSSFRPMSVVAKRTRARWIKMPFGMGVGLGAGDFVLDGDPAAPKKWAQLPNFWPMSIAAKRLDGARCHFVGR